MKSIQLMSFNSYQMYYTDPGAACKLFGETMSTCMFYFLSQMLCSLSVCRVNSTATVLPLVLALNYIFKHPFVNDCIVSKLHVVPMFCLFFLHAGNSSMLTL